MLGLCQLKLNQWKSVSADLCISFEFQWLREWWYRGEIWSACARRQQLVVVVGWYKGRARRSHRLVTSRRPTLLVPPASPIFLFNHGESSLFLITGQKRVKKSIESLVVGLHYLCHRPVLPSSYSNHGESMTHWVITLSHPQLVVTSNESAQ